MDEDPNGAKEASKVPRNALVGKHQNLSVRSTRSPRLLPPLATWEATTSEGCLSPGIESPVTDEGSGSRYHSGCRSKCSLYLDWNDVKSEKHTGNPGRIYRQGKARSMSLFKGLDEQDIAHFLDQNKEFLEAYVMDKVPVNILEKWITRKSKRNYCSPTTSPRQLGKCKQKKKSYHKEIFMGLLNGLQDNPNEHAVLWELANHIVTSVRVDAFRVYKLYPDHPSFVQYFINDPKSLDNTFKKLVRAEPRDVKLVLEVAKTGSCQRFTRTLSSPRMPYGPSMDTKNAKHGNYAMYQPILSKSGKTVYVIEMWRLKDNFKDIDQEISSNFLVLGSLALHYCNSYLDKKRERNMSDFLLDVVKAIFEEMISLDQLIKRILEFAQRLVNADRASLFLVDYRNFELVSTVFDLKFEPGHERDMEKKEIRMPINRGIAGHVALSGETMNIPDAYSDHRFNREVDEATGYKTISILCMPIKCEGRVIGVVQMVNKRNDQNFGHEDEVAFEIFSTFFGLALHHARLYDRIMRKEQKYRVALEVLSYHNTCRENEVVSMLSDTNPIDADLNDFYLDPFRFNEFEKCKCVIRMFSELFDLSKFDVGTLTRFVLTVKKNYRTVPYHNFDHGWTVAHSMYVILKNDHQKRFSYSMRLALFVACLCHDLDHRGYTNKYMSEIASPLAAMYTTSTLEHHHFNITVTILQQDGHNIFSHTSSEDYKDILGHIRHCILATDLAAFFPNLKKITQLHDGEMPKFSWDSHVHRDLAMAITMTASDLSAAAKPWDIQIKTVKVIFEEFYDQGDKERAAGREPIAMMDRNKTEEQPASQVGFLRQICIPCYSILYKILPHTKPLYDMSSKNLEGWKSRADRIQREFENIPLEEENVEESEENVINVPILEDNIKVDVTEVKKNPETVHDDIIEHNCELSWDEDDAEFQESELVRHGIWKHEDGETWIDEEGVVVTKNALKAILCKKCK